MTKRKARIADWPEGYVDELREGEFEGLDEAEVLEALTAGFPEMRFGQFIDLNLQQGYYLHTGSGNITRPQGTGTGFVLGAMAALTISVTNSGDVEWWVNADAETYYSRYGREKLAWVFANASGPWFLTADMEEGKYEHWYWLVIRFLSVEDERAFLAAYPEAGR